MNLTLKLQRFTHIRASRKCSQCFTFSTFYVTALFQNGFNKHILKIQHTIPHNDKVKKFSLILIDLPKLRTKIHVHKYSQPLLYTLLKHLWLQLWCYKLGTPILGQPLSSLQDLKLHQVGCKFIIVFHFSFLFRLDFLFSNSVKF